MGMATYINNVLDAINREFPEANVADSHSGQPSSDLGQKHWASEIELTAGNGSRMYYPITDSDALAETAGDQELASQVLSADGVVIENIQPVGLNDMEVLYFSVGIKMEMESEPVVHFGFINTDIGRLHLVPEAILMSGPNHFAGLIMGMYPAPEIADQSIVIDFGNHEE